MPLFAASDAQGGNVGSVPDGSPVGEAVPPAASEGMGLEENPSAPHADPGARSTRDTPQQPATPPQPPQSPPTNAAPIAGLVDSAFGRRRAARYGLLLQFESLPEDPELARLVDSTIWINDAHPAFARAATSRSLGYHTALAVALALAPLTVEPHHEHAFITQFLAHWGATGDGATRRTRRRRPRVEIPQGGTGAQGSASGRPA